MAAVRSPPAASVVSLIDRYVMDMEGFLLRDKYLNGVVIVRIENSALVGIELMHPSLVTRSSK
jgi:hypothetical protein